MFPDPGVCLPLTILLVILWQWFYEKVIPWIVRNANKYIFKKGD